MRQRREEGEGPGLEALSDPDASSSRGRGRPAYTTPRLSIATAVYQGASAAQLSGGSESLSILCPRAAVGDGVGLGVPENRSGSACRRAAGDAIIANRAAAWSRLGRGDTLVERQSKDQRDQAVRHVCNHCSVCRWRWMAWLPVVRIAQCCPLRGCTARLVSLSLPPLAPCMQVYWFPLRATGCPTPRPH